MACVVCFLQVHVLRAEGIPKMDVLGGWSDTYVDLWVRGRAKRRTNVVPRSATPVWQGQSFQLMVHTRRYQVGGWISESTLICTVRTVSHVKIHC